MYLEWHCGFSKDDESAEHYFRKEFGLQKKDTKIPAKYSPKVCLILDPTKPESLELQLR